MLTEIITGTAPVVHTAGVNWQSVGTIFASVTGGTGASMLSAARYVVRRVERSRRAAAAAQEKMVRDLVNGVSSVVDAKLARVNEHLEEQDKRHAASSRELAARQDVTAAQLADVRERSARIEGILART